MIVRKLVVLLCKILVIRVQPLSPHPANFRQRRFAPFRPKFWRRQIIVRFRHYDAFQRIPDIKAIPKRRQHQAILYDIYRVCVVSPFTTPRQAPMKENSTLHDAIVDDAYERRVRLIVCAKT